MAIFNASLTGALIYSLGKPANSKGHAGTVEQAVVDGDTIRVLLPGGQGLRFLGCDTPEKRIELPLRPGTSAPEKKRDAPHFVPLNDPQWDEFLDSVFDNERWGPFKPTLSAALTRHLKSRIKDNAAGNQWTHATAATKGLQDLIEKDCKTRGIDSEALTFFIAYAHEVLDRYGRPLVFINISEKDKDRRPESYNLRMIAAGLASPFFMWPNIDPFRKLSVLEAAMTPKELRRMTGRSQSLQGARTAAAEARKAGKGIYGGKDPLQLLAFELRFLARRAAPDRYVIDLSADDNALIPPTKYFTVPNQEDRLFVPAEYVPLFKEKGWE